MELDILKLLSYSPFAIVAYFLFKSGILGAIATRIRGAENGHEKRIHKLESNDIKHIEEDMVGVRSDIQRIFERLDEHGNRLTRMETKINGR